MEYTKDSINGLLIVTEIGNNYTISLFDSDNISLTCDDGRIFPNHCSVKRAIEILNSGGWQIISKPETTFLIFN